MKKIIKIVIYLMTICMSTNVSTTVHAQNNHLYMNVTEYENGHHFYLCVNTYDSITISKDPNCSGSITWQVGYFPEGTGTFYHTDEITIPFNNTYDCVQIIYWGCDISEKWCQFHPITFDIPEPWTQDYIWKRPNESVTLEAYAQNVNNEWSTGETGRYLTITEPGTYWVHMYNDCGELWDTIQVRNNVEIESASVDPDSNKNLVTWETTPEQAEYISQVTIARDGMDIATVPYTDGQFLDNIGSDLAARIYTITGVCTDGTLCPIPSLERGTIHMAFLPDINGNVEMTWNAPYLGGAPIHVGRYEICEYDPTAKGEVIVIDFVSPSTMSYSCSQSMFNYGYPLIRAVIQDGRSEKDMLSNRTEDLVGIHEESRSFKIYPNPSNGVINVKYDGQDGLQNEILITIYDMVGQIVTTGTMTNSVFTTERLSPGIYAVKVGKNVEKVVVQ